jgi:hypothetical protein
MLALADFYARLAAVLSLKVTAAAVFIVFIVITAGPPADHQRHSPPGGSISFFQSICLLGCIVSDGRRGHRLLGGKRCL